MKETYYLERELLKKIDLTIDNTYHITPMQLMECAGLQIATYILEHLPEWTNILCCCGKGHNGGDGLVAARHLINHNKTVTVLLLDDVNQLKSTCKQHLNAIIKNNGIIQHHQDNVSINNSGYDGIIDAMLGFSLESPPRPHYTTLIQTLNKSDIPILSIDIPSGLDANTGIPHPPTICASTTLTLGFPKKGFLSKSAQPYLGTLYLVDIGLPKALYENISIQTPFQENNAIMPLDSH